MERKECKIKPVEESNPSSGTLPLRRKNKPGQGRKLGEPTVTPGLRIKRSLWKAFVEAYPGQANQLFNEFVTNMIQNKYK